MTLPRIFYRIEEVAEICGITKRHLEMFIYPHRNDDGERVPPLEPRLYLTPIGQRLKRIHVDELHRWTRSLTGSASALDCIPLLKTKIQVIEKRTGTD